MTDPADRVADLVRALAIIKPEDDAHLQQIGSVLGFEPGHQPTRPVHRPRRRWRSLRRLFRVGRSFALALLILAALVGILWAALVGWIGGTTAAVVIVSLASIALAGLLRWLRPSTDRSPAMVPAPLPSVAPQGGLVRPGRGSDAFATVATPPPPPDLVAAYRRPTLEAIVFAAAVPSGEPDVERMVVAAASRRPAADLPFRFRSRWRSVDYAFVDVGPSCQPFRADFDRLVESLIMGRNMVTTLLRFAGEPSGGLLHQDGYLQPLDPAVPPPGSSVLVLSDLGIGRKDAASPYRWARFDDMLRRRQCRVRYLCPYPTARLSPLLDHIGVISLADFEVTR